MASQTPNHLDEHIGQRMRLRRELTGRTQAEVAEAAGLSNGALVQKYEAGKSKVTARTLYLIAQALNVPIGYFFEELPTYVLTETQRESAFRRFIGSATGIAAITRMMELTPKELAFVITIVTNLHPLRSD